MATLKPDLTRVWANGAPPGNVVDPDTTTPGKVLAGWQAEVPPFEHFNFLQKWFTQGLAHFNEQGIGVWDTDTTYPVNGMTKGSDGNLYKAVDEQSGNDTVSDDGSNWLRLPVEVINSLSSLNSTYPNHLPNIEINENSQKTVGKGYKLLGYDLSDTRINWTGDTSGLFYDANTSEPNDGEIAHMSLLGGGTSQPGQNSGILYESDSGNNPQRNHHHHLQIEGWSYAGVTFSGGWGNIVSQSRLTNNKIGIKWDTSFLPGWAGSGQLTYCNYIAGNEVGYHNSTGWANTSINDVIQSQSSEGIIASGNSQVFINTWLEDNGADPLISRGPVIIGGRGWTFRPTLDTDLSVPDEAVMRIDQTQISVFRDQNNPMFFCGGRGITNLNNIQPSLPQRQRNFQRIQDGTYSTVWSVSSTNNYFDHTNTQEAATQLNDNFRTAEIRLEGNGNSANSGTGNGRFIIATGSYKRDGSTPPTPFRDQWEFDIDGYFNPLNDGQQNIGVGSQRLKDLYIVNNPTVGSDVRIKQDIQSIPQEFLDFALSVEIKQYKLKVNDSGRNHYGIVIDEAFIDSLEAIYSIDDCAALCHDVFTNDDGAPIKKHLHGNKEQILFDDYVDDSYISYVLLPDNGNILVGDEVAGMIDEGVVTIVDDNLSIGSEGIEYKQEILPAENTDEEIRVPKLYVETGGIRLGDLWQVRYAEWQNILLEAMRRKLVNL